MASDLLAGLVEDLDELSGEVRAFVVGVPCYPADLAAGPIRRVGLLSAVIPGEIFVVDLLLDFAIGPDGARLRHLAGSVVVHFNFSADAVALYFRVLSNRCCGPERQQHARREHPQNTQNESVPILLHVMTP